jgi:hypothetical protein
MSVRQQQQKDGRVIYFLADDLGQIWLGGWFDRSVAEDRLQQAEACNWSAEQMDCSVDVAL